MIIVLERLGIEVTYLNMIKAAYSKSLANINLNGEKYKVSKIRNKTSLFTLSIINQYGT